LSVGDWTAIYAHSLGNSLRADFAPREPSHNWIEFGEQADIIIDVPLGINGALDVVTHLPPISVAGQANNIASFQRDVAHSLTKLTRALRKQLRQPTA
jgi:hypothetical protein